MSYIERTARKIYPILNCLKKRMIPEKKIKSANAIGRSSGSRRKRGKLDDAGSASDSD